MSCAVGAGLLAAGWRLRLSGKLPGYDVPGATLAAVCGGALLLFALAVGLLAARIAPAFDDAPVLPRHPYLKLLLASFTALFVEVMLIRYSGSQIRIFSL